MTKKAAASGLGELVLVDDAVELRLLGGAWPLRPRQPPAPAPVIESLEVFLESPSPLRLLRDLRIELDLERMSSPRSNIADRERPKGDFPDFSIVLQLVDSRLNIADRERPKGDFPDFSIVLIAAE